MNSHGPLSYSAIVCVNNPTYPSWIHVFYQDQGGGLWRKTFAPHANDKPHAAAGSSHPGPASRGSLHPDTHSLGYHTSDNNNTAQFYPMSLRTPLSACNINYEPHCFSLNKDLYLSQEVPYQMPLVPAASYSKLAVASDPTPPKLPNDGKGWIYYQKQGEVSIREVDIPKKKGSDDGDGIEIPGTADFALQGTDLAAVADTATTRIVVFQSNDGDLYALRCNQKWNGPEKIVSRDQCSFPTHTSITKFDTGKVCLYFLSKDKKFPVYRICWESDKWDTAPVGVNLTHSILKQSFFGAAVWDAKAGDAIIFYQDDQEGALVHDVDKL